MALLECVDSPELPDLYETSDKHPLKDHQQLCSRGRMERVSRLSQQGAADTSQRETGIYVGEMKEKQMLLCGGITRGTNTVPECLYSKVFSFPDNLQHRNFNNLIEKNVSKDETSGVHSGCEDKGNSEDQ